MKLYAATGAADSVFFLSEGSVYFYLSNVDKYAISGKNLIVGSTEIIMKKFLGTDSGRIETAVADGGSDIKKISLEKFIAGLSNYSFALNAAMVLAKQVMLTNKILQKNLKDLEGEESKMREYATAYYSIVGRLKQEYDKRRLPWLKELVEQYDGTLTSKKGEAYVKSSEPSTMTVAASLSDKEIEYQRGSVICEENTPGDELFILKSGAIDLFLNGSKISMIDQPGTVIGEMALLLGENRAATLKAKNTVIMTRVRKNDLKEVAEKQDDFLLNIAMTLARRHYYNVARIETVNKSLAEQLLDREAAGGDKKAMLSRRAHHDLTLLKNRLEDVVMEKKADFLQDLVDSL